MAYALTPTEATFAVPGEMARLMREYDWRRTALGPVETWPHALRTILHALLGTRHPMFLFWGPELTQFYNDGYRPSLGSGDQHPAALGARGRDFWREIWPIIGPQIDAVMTRGESSWHEDSLVPIIRNGRTEEVFWTYSFSPVLDDQGGIGGTLVTCQETTGRVLLERRLAMLSLLSRELASAGQDAPALYRAAADVLASAAADVPLVLLYSLSPDGQTLALEAARGAGAEILAPQTIDCADPTDAGWPLRSVVRDRQPRGVDDIHRRFGRVVAGPWPEPLTSALMLPIASAATDQLFGVLIAGISPRLTCDAPYQDALTLAANQISGALANAGATANERRRAKALGESEARARMAIETARLGTWWYDVERASVELDQRMCEIWGVSSAASEMSLDALFERVHPDDRPRVNDATAGMRSADGVGAYSVDYRIIWPDGTERWLVVNGQAVYEGSSAARRLVGVTGSVMDITDRKEAEAELVRALAAKDEFLGLVSHELRTPITTILGNADVLVRHGYALPEAARIGALADIKQDAERLNLIICDMLTLARAVAGVLEPEPIALQPAVRAIAKGHPSAARVAITVSGDEELIVVDAESGVLSQILGNFLSNAEKYGAGAPVEIAVTRDAAEAFVRVLDRGIGVDAEETEQLFEAFYRSSRNPTIGGVGIGLSVCRRLADAVGGRVWGATRDGGGSEFGLALPLYCDDQTDPD